MNRASKKKSKSQRCRPCRSLHLRPRPSPSSHKRRISGCSRHLCPRRLPSRRGEKQSLPASQAARRGGRRRPRPVPRRRRAGQSRLVRITCGTLLRSIPQKRSERTARSSSLSCRRERCWARGISDAHQKLRLSDFGRFGARGGAQMEVPSGDHRRSQGFLDSESSGSIHARLEARR